MIRIYPRVCADSSPIMESYVVVCSTWNNPCAVKTCKTDKMRCLIKHQRIANKIDAWWYIHIWKRKRTHASESSRPEETKEIITGKDFVRAYQGIGQSRTIKLSSYIAPKKAQMHASSSFVISVVVFTLNNSFYAWGRKSMQHAQGPYRLISYAETQVVCAVGTNCETEKTMHRCWHDKNKSNSTSSCQDAIKQKKDNDNKPNERITGTWKKMKHLRGIREEHTERGAQERD